MLWGTLFPNSRCKTSVLAVADGPTCIAPSYFPPADWRYEKAPDCAALSFNQLTIFWLPLNNRNWASPVIFGSSSVVINTRSLPCFPDPYPGSKITTVKHKSSTLRPALELRLHGVCIICKTHVTHKYRLPASAPARFYACRRILSRLSGRDPVSF